MELLIKENTKRAIKQKLNKRYYHVQDNGDVAQKDVKIYCIKTHFPLLQFFAPHTKPHGVRGLIKYYHVQLKKTAHGTCAILCIPCFYSKLISVLDKPYIPCLPPYKQLSYQPVKYFT